MAIKLTINLSDQAQAGWQMHLDNVVNPARQKQDLLPHTLDTFFQEAEEATGVQQFVRAQRVAAIKQKIMRDEEVTQAEMQVVLQAMRR